MKKIYKVIALMFLVFGAVKPTVAQNNNNGLMKQVMRENEDAVYAIAMYPRDTRKIIFEASEYPEVISKLNAMQKNSQSAFENLISNLSKEEQEAIWNLTRYDGLIAELAFDHRKSDNEINNILVNYPEEIHKTAFEEALNNYDLLFQIDQMNKNYNSDFEFLISIYPSEAINAFREIIKLPEVLSILFDHMQYTVLIGDYYKKNPERVLHKTDSLNFVLAQRNNQEVDDWKQSMNNNPQAQEQYTQAAQEYAQSNGYQPDDFNTPLTLPANFYINPYVWWFGYPSWYPPNYWTPYPYWYDLGYYYDPIGHPVFFGLPSRSFMYWYFYYPEHFNSYPELSNHYYNYYYSHRGSMNNNSISHGVNEWRNRNRDIVNDDWDKDNTNRTQRFKEYGQMEIDRKKHNTKNPQQQMSQIDYIEKKHSKYPTLYVDISKRQVVQIDTKTKYVQENIPEPVKLPRVVTPNQYKAPVNGQLNNRQQPGQNQQQHTTNNNNIPNNNTIKQQQPTFNNPQKNNNDTKQRLDNVTIQPKNTNSVKQNENANQIRNAQQYHQNTWSQPQQRNNPPPQRQEESRPVQQPVKQEIQTPSNNNRR